MPLAAPVIKATSPEMDRLNFDNRGMSVSRFVHWK